MMNLKTGQKMTTEQHVAQSIETILFTLQGTRLRRRQFGSLVPVLIDATLTAYCIAQIRAASVMAIMRWEPRYKIETVTVSALENGVNIEFNGYLYDTHQTYNYMVTA